MGLAFYHSEKLDYAKISPQEHTRMKITKDIARIHVRNLINSVKDVPTEFAFNIDGVSCQE
jgi:hypothetical protein